MPSCANNVVIISYINKMIFTGNGNSRALSPHAVPLGAADPQLEQLQDRSANEDNLSSGTPAAAWVLATLFLISMMRTTYSDNVISEVSSLLAQADVRQTKQNKPYSKRLMIFCMTLAGYSWHAYCFLRTTVKNCLPCRSTLTKYRNKVDGSPGFSLAALKMVKNKVVELAADSKNCI